MADPPPYPGIPRWVKLSAIAAGILALLIMISMFASGGRHGPGRHMPSGQTAAPHEGGQR